MKYSHILYAFIFLFPNNILAQLTLSGNITLNNKITKGTNITIIVSCNQGKAKKMTYTDNGTYKISIDNARISCECIIEAYETQGTTIFLSREQFDVEEKEFDINFDKNSNAKNKDELIMLLRNWNQELVGWLKIAREDLKLLGEKIKELESTNKNLKVYKTKHFNLNQQYKKLEEDQKLLKARIEKVLLGSISKVIYDDLQREKDRLLDKFQELKIEHSSLGKEFLEYKKRMEDKLKRMHEVLITKTFVSDCTCLYTNIDDILKVQILMKTSFIDDTISGVFIDSDLPLNRGISFGVRLERLKHTEHPWEIVKTYKGQNYWQFENHFFGADPITFELKTKNNELNEKRKLDKTLRYKITVFSIELNKEGRELGRFEFFIGHNRKGLNKCLESNKLNSLPKEKRTETKPYKNQRTRTAY